MKLKFKALAAAAVMVVAGHASAALSDAFVQNGTLFLSVYDNLTNNSYIRDLGVSLDSFLPTGSLVSTAGVTRDSTFANFAGSSNFTTLFAGATAGNIRWNVIGYDSTEGDAGFNNGMRLVTTYSGPGFAPTNGGVRNAAQGATNIAGAAIFNSGVAFDGAPTDGAFPGGALESYGGKSFQNLLDGTGGQGFFVNNFGAAQFWFAGTGTDTSSDAAAANIRTRFGNSPSNFATFSLNTNGDVTYALMAAAPAAVPIPAAAWLMGSGLLGLGGLMRRRKAARAA